MPSKAGLTVAKSYIGMSLHEVYVMEWIHPNQAPGALLNPGNVDVYSLEERGSLWLSIQKDLTSARESTHIYEMYSNYLGWRSAVTHLRDLVSEECQNRSKTKILSKRGNDFSLST